MFVKVKKEKPGERYRYERFIKSTYRHLFDMTNGIDVCGGKEVHSTGDEVKQNNDSDKQVLERRGLLSQVDDETGDTV